MISDLQYRVSVVIPTHNRPLLARRAIASALAQSINIFEIIVVDDCSDQIFNVQNTIMSFNDDRIIYRRHNKSLGPSATRNTGIDLAKGDFIAFLDDDDIWLENKLEKQLESIHNNPASLCGFFTHCSAHAGKGRRELGYKDFIYERNYAINSGLVVRSDVIKDIRYDNNLRVGEDLDFVFKILRSGNIAYLNNSYYFVNLGNHERITTEHKGDLETLEYRLQFIKKNMDIYGTFLGNYTKASILLKGLKYNRDKINIIGKIIKRCGLTATTFALYRKFINKLS